MKYITLIRHGKAENATKTINDFKRVLTEKGEADAKLIGEYIKQVLPKVDLIISSTAFRALKTAQIIAEQIKFPKEKIKEENDMYDTNSPFYFDMLTVLPVTTHHVVLVGHNPEISDFVSLITNKDTEMGTCNLAHVTVDTFNWEDVDISTGVLKEFTTPKDLFS